MFVKLRQWLSLSVSNAILGISHKPKLRTTTPQLPPPFTIPFISSLLQPPVIINSFQFIALFPPSLRLHSTSYLLTSPRSSFLTPSVTNTTSPRRFAFSNGLLSSPISRLIPPFTRRFFASSERLGPSNR